MNTSTRTRALPLIRRAGLERTLSKIRGRTRFFDPTARGGPYLLDHRIPWVPPAGLAGNLRLSAFLVHRLLRHRTNPFALEDRPDLDAQSALEVARDPWVREILVRAPHIAGALAEPEGTDPSLLHLMRLLQIILLTDYLSLAGRTSSLHEALASRLRVRREAPVERLVVEQGRIVGVALAGTGEVQRADHVVVATDAPRAARIVPGDWPTECEFLGGVQMPPVLIATFFLDRPLEKGVWSYFSKAGSAKRVALWVDAAQKNPAMAPSGKAVLQAWVCAPASSAMFPLTDSAVIDECLRDTEEHIPGIASWVEEAHLTRHTAGVPQHPVGHHSRALWFLASADRRPGVSFCGDYLSGGYMEPALWSAERVAARVGL